MKRYDIGIGHYDTGVFLDADLDPHGEWVRYHEVAPFVDALSAFAATFKGATGQVVFQTDEQLKAFVSVLRAFEAIKGGPQ